MSKVAELVSTRNWTQVVQLQSSYSFWLALLPVSKVCRLIRCSCETKAVIDGVKGSRPHLCVPLANCSWEGRDSSWNLFSILFPSPSPAERLRVWGTRPLWLGIDGEQGGLN